MDEYSRDNKQYQRILDTVPDMVYVLDADFHFMFINDAIVDLTGYDREELLGAHASLLFNTEAMDKGRWNRDQLEQANIESGRVETELKTAHNDRIPVEIRGQLCPDYDDEPGINTVGIIRDISERRQRDRELQARSSAMEASIDGMAILDTNGEYVFVNRSHADVYGYDTPDAFLGETWRTCYSDDEIARFEETVMPTLSEEGEWRGEAIGTRKDGSTFPQELSLSVTEDERVICVVRDISERKQRERELRRQNERLEEFASVVSHDLRNPLHVAQGRVELALRESDSEHLEDAANALDRCQTLVDELFTLAQVGGDAGEIEPVDIAGATEDCWRNVETADAELVVKIEQTIHADPSRLRQLIENLIRNAIKHGGEDVRITVGELEDGFYIADDGAGIPDDERERLFDAGYTTADEGTGFGLNIVQDIADAHGWNVRVIESATGGARFELTGVT